MPAHAVLIVDEDLPRCAEMITRLQAAGVDATGDLPSSPVARLIEAAEPRIVICRQDSCGVALFHTLQEADDPPIVVLLSDDPSAVNAFQGNGRLLVIRLRTPDEFTLLAAFVKSVIDVTSRLDPRDGTTRPLPLPARGPGPASRPAV